MADKKQKCPMCGTKLIMINGRLTCKTCGYYYRNPNEQADYDLGRYNPSPQKTSVGNGYASNPQGGFQTRTTGNAGTANNPAKKQPEKKKHGAQAAGIVAAIVIGIVVRTFITLYNDGFFNSAPPSDNRDRAEALLNSMGYSMNSSAEKEETEETQASQILSAGSAALASDTARLPQSDFFRSIAEAVWEKDYSLITSEEYASLTALSIDREEKTISYQLNNGVTENLTFQNDFGKKLSDLACFTGLEWLALDDSLAEGDLDGLDKLYAVHAENSITELCSIIPNPEGILDLSIEDSLFTISLEGIEAFPNLQYLFLDCWALEDISALSMLPDLQGLALQNCDRLTDYSPLMELSGLTELSLDAAQLRSIDFIREMPGLTYLSVENSLITDLAALSACPDIHTLYLDGNYYMEDYTGLDSLENLADLTLELNYSNQMPSFENLDSLQFLTLKYANDLSLLEKAPNVTYLCLDYCTSEGLEAITSMKELTTLEIHEFSYYTESLEPLTRLPRLTELDLEDTYIYGNINELFGIPTLTYLNLSGCRGIVDFENLPVNENLQYLLLNDVSFADAALYDPWGGWEEVSLSDHYAFFSCFPNLTDLYIESNGIDSIAFVENLPHLQYLDITDNNVTSLKPLEMLYEFRAVWCSQNTILEKLPENSDIIVITDSD